MTAAPMPIQRRSVDLAADLALLSRPGRIGCVHTGHADIAVPALTTDSDLVIEPFRLKDEPRLVEAMERAQSRLVAG